MAACKATTNTTNVVSSASSSSTATTTNNIGHNFHELCRSCGKTNAELYDLFQTTNNSPFSTSSTTCYTHLNNCSSSSSSAIISPLFTTTNKPSTSSATDTSAATSLAAGGCTKSSSVSQTFDSLAATAKASAKGQSNMDNIIQEMQIWQLLIKCNDGLPQRICAKCTAQFYMIHKFRRKCLKVQTQLRALYEEQQKFYERQQQQNEKNVTVKDATIEETSTPPRPASPVVAMAIGIGIGIAAAPTESTVLLGDVVKSPAMHKVNDLVNDNCYGEQQQAVVDNTNTNTTKASVSFEANTGNTNDFIAPAPAPSTTVATTLLENIAETMQQKTEANDKPTPTSSAPAPAPAASIDKTFEARIQEHYCTLTTGLKIKDEKIPLLKPAVLIPDARRSPPLTFQQPLEQICDNDTTTTTDQMNATSRKLCFDPEELLEAHITIKTNNIENYTRQNQSQRRNTDQLLFEKNARDSGRNTPCFGSSPSSFVLNKANASAFKLRLHQQLNLRKDSSAAAGAAAAAAALLNKANSESLFITKAALKAYTIPPSTSETTENRDYQKPITNSEAAAIDNIKNANDNNNNADSRDICSHRYDSNRTDKLNDNACSSTSNSISNSTPSPSSCSSTQLSGLSIKQKHNHKHKHKHSIRKVRNIHRRRKIIKYSNHNRRPGHCYKLNAGEEATTKMARTTTVLNYGGGMIVKSKQRRLQYKQTNNKLKRLLPNTAETSSTSSRARRRKQQQRQQEKFKLSHKKSLQQQQQQRQRRQQPRDLEMKDGMSSTVSTTSSRTSTPSQSPSSSSSAISSTSSPSSSSLHLRATTPAVTDLVRNNCAADVTSYHRNASENINKTACSSADRLSSNESCIMWKTKAAMKANANDMPIEVVVVNNNDNTDDGDGKDISLPYTAVVTATASATVTKTTALTTDSSSSLLYLPLAATEPHISSKAFYENQNININSNNSSIANNNNDNNLMEKYSSHNKVMSSLPCNQVKDTKDESEYLQEATISICNLWPEEAGQKQINTNNRPTAAAVNEQSTIAAQIEKHTIYNNSDSGHNEREKDEQKQQQQQQAFILTPPAKTGSMKLIIQRKRGARFKCRRKDDDEIPATHDNHKPPARKRKRKSSQHTNQQNKLEMHDQLDDNNSSMQAEEALPNDDDNLLSDSQLNGGHNEKLISMVTNYEFDSDGSNVSVYRDPLLLRNEMLEEDSHLADFSKTQLSLQTECSKEMYKLYKEKANLESPKKLIVRVPLTSLTQDFKKLHLTMQDNEVENETATKEAPGDTQVEIPNEETLCIEVRHEQQEDSPAEEEGSLMANTTSSQSDLLGFSQSTETPSDATDSSQPSLELRCIEAPLCSASSKINDFINDFQNNCIDSSEIDETCDMIPTLAPHITQELSDEIRDVEDTLNGIISEMHDKDMYNTPRSGETDEFLAHSVYSPLTDSPTTPSQSFYAESPCTINSNPMSVSPFIHGQNMDYNAMTPQSNHSSSMGVGCTYMGGGAGAGPQTGVYSEHYPTYNECFEETTQSELIGFQNDIPCFENIEMATNELLQTETKEEDDPAAIYTTDNSVTINTAAQSCRLNNNVEEEASAANVDYIDLSAYKDEPADDFVAASPQLMPQVRVSALPEMPLPASQQIPYSPANYHQFHNAATLQMQNAASPLMRSTTVTQPHHYIVTSTNQGPIIIANPRLNSTAEQIDHSFKPHSNNLHFVTLGQAMEANRTAANQLINNNQTTTAKLNWPTSVTTTPSFNQQPVLSTNNGTTTYFINTNGGLYQANIPTANLQSQSVNTIFMPPNTAQTFNKANIDSNDNYVQAIQQQQRAQQSNNGQSSQYIMLVNNLRTSPQYYTTTAATTNHNNLHQTVSPSQQQNISTPTVLFHPTQAQNVQQSNRNFRTNSPPNQSNTNNLSQTVTPSAQHRAATPATVLFHPTPQTASPSPQQHNSSTPTTVLFHPTQQQQQQSNNDGFRINSPVNQNNTETKKAINVVPTTPILESSKTDTTTTSGPTVHQRVNQQLQTQIKQRQLHILQPRSPNREQKITLVCRFCHKRPKFTNNVDYSNHIINTHPAEKPYNCPHCPIHYSRRSERQMHVAQVHGARYQCAQCGLTFCTQRALDFHLQKHHANIERSHHHPQLNSSPTTAPTAATYQLLQHNQQQRLVRVEDVHVQVTDENKNKRSIDLTLDGGAAEISHTTRTQQQQQQEQQQQLEQQQQSRKLCCPDCNGDNDDCCGANQNHDQIYNGSNTAQIAENNLQKYAGNESVNNPPQQQQQQQHPQHVTIPSPEQTEPDSTTTLRHFRKRQLCEISTHFASVSPSSSTSAPSPSLHSSNNNSNSNAGNNSGGGNDIININHNSPDNVLVGDGGGGGEQIVVERALRGSHNCLLCEESFTNEIALRKHHNLAHGAAAAATQSTTCSSATTTTSTSMPLVCTICKRGFRMRNALQRHMETHDAEGRPYECNICQVRFPRPSQLTLHKLTVHKFEKPISCEECGKQFGTESAMKAHAAEHEKDANAIIASSSEAASTSTSTLSSQSQLSSHFYLNTITTTAAASTNEQNINLLSPASGEISSASSSSSASTNNNNNNNDTFNNATQSVFVTGPVT